jgi:capsular polysaccharide export protein
LLRLPSLWGRPVPEIGTPIGADAPYADIVTRLLLGEEIFQPDFLRRAAVGIRFVVDARIGGECWGPAASIDASPGGDALLVAGDVEDCRRMRDAVQAERGDRVVFLLPSEGGRSQEAMRAFARVNDWRLVDHGVDPWSLLPAVAAVFTVDHEIGFLALLCGLPVRCFGGPFYAGWGVTEDDACAPRGADRSVAQIFAAYCILGTRYRDPCTGRRIDFESAADIVAEWRRIDRVNRRIGVCVGMSIWKHGRMRDMLRSSAGAPSFAVRSKRAVEIARGGAKSIAVWATRQPAGLVRQADAAGILILRVEDGFVRSVGLGADFMPAASIIVDSAGIYYDPGQESDLETILNGASFDDRMLDRARRLIQMLILRGVTKYNTGAGMPALPPAPGRVRIFVPGQVENDQSVRLGGAGIDSNIALLRQVRAQNPEAFIIYKPHPDVDAGHRPGAVADADALRLADFVLRGVSSAGIINAVDEVHTLTSLCGFEALIRHRKVVTYGAPFYAGWGLTEDRTQMLRRRRRLSLEQLIAGALIVYPRYLDPVTRLPCGPEILIERLSTPECWHAGPLVTLRRFQGATMKRLRQFGGATPIGRPQREHGA